ncbi:MAG: hypothetical protein ACFFAS_06135 [Promethearchaeota archaeon]
MNDNLQEQIIKELTDGNNGVAFSKIKKLIGKESSIKLLKQIIKTNGRSLKGLVIDGYVGDFPTFIEPVVLTPGVKIGDTALLGPNVLIGDRCELGAFCEITNSILLENVNLGKHCKLDYCVVDSELILPDEYRASNCLLKLNEEGEIEHIEI